MKHSVQSCFSVFLLEPTWQRHILLLGWRYDFHPILTITSCIWCHNVTTYLDSINYISDEMCLFWFYFVTLVQWITMEINVHCLDCSDRYTVVILLESAVFNSIVTIYLSHFYNPLSCAQNCCISKDMMHFDTFKRETFQVWLAWY